MIVGPDPQLRSSFELGRLRERLSSLNSREKLGPAGLYDCTVIVPKEVIENS